MKNRFIKVLLLVVMVIGVTFFFTSCGNKNTGYNTLYLEQTASTSQGCACAGTQYSMSKQEWLTSTIENGVSYNIKKQSSDEVRVSNTEEYTTKIENAKKEIISLNEVIVNAQKIIDHEISGDESQAEIDKTNAQNSISEQEVIISTQTELRNAKYLENLVDLINQYPKFGPIAGVNDSNTEEIANNFKVAHIMNDITSYLEYTNNITDFSNEDIPSSVVNTLNGAVGCIDVNNTKGCKNELINADSCTNVYKLGALYMIQVEQRLLEVEPVKWKKGFFAHLWNNLFIFPLTWLIYEISKIFGGFYIIGLLITTLLVRTLGWPIYAKSNDMSNKMASLQPELQKIQEKYAGRQDPESQRMMQMEQAKLYRDNKIGLGGCLAPLLQFPIFMAIYTAVRRLPYTKAIPNSTYTVNWANELKSKFLGIDLFEDYTGGGTIQLIGVLVLVALVVGTQILTQIISEQRQKKMKEKSQENIPEYRRQAYKQEQNQTASSMKMMMWMMTFMMGLFVWQSKAGLGVYWLIGNLYSLLQTEINNKISEKKRIKAEESKGIFTYKNK